MSGATIATLAGCAGGDDEGSGGTTAEPTTAEPTTATTSGPESLEIENVHFASEQPTGYREYTEQPDATYRPDDVVWVYFEPSTVGTKPAGEGEVKFSYDVEWTVYAPDGEALETLSDQIERTVPDSADLSQVFLMVNFSPSLEFEPGTHQLDLEVRDRFADTSASTTLEFDVERDLEQTEGSFGVPEVVFTENEASGYDEYTRQPNAEYSPRDRVWYYYEIDGIHYEESEETKVTDVSIYETLTGPEDEVWSETDIPLANEFDASADLSTFYVADSIAPAEEWELGTYTLTLEVTDGYVDETETVTGTFTVVE